MKYQNLPEYAQAHPSLKIAMPKFSHRQYKKHHKSARNGACKCRFKCETTQKMIQYLQMDILIACCRLDLWASASPLTLLRHTIYTVAPLQKHENTRHMRYAWYGCGIEDLWQECRTVQLGPLQLHSQCQNLPLWQHNSSLLFVLAYLLIWNSLHAPWHRRLSRCNVSNPLIHTHTHTNTHMEGGEEWYF